MNKLAPDTVRLTPEHLDEIRASVDWQAMFGGLGLRKAEGKSKPNDWWAFSPFHEEKTPSFHMGPGGLRNTPPNWPSWNRAEKNWKTL